MKHCGLLIYKAETKAFFVYGFAKNTRANIRSNELSALRIYADVLLGLDAKALKNAVQSGALIEIEEHG